MVSDKCVRVVCVWEREKNRETYLSASFELMFVACRRHPGIHHTQHHSLKSSTTHQPGPPFLAFCLPWSTVPQHPNRKHTRTLLTPLMHPVTQGKPFFPRIKSLGSFFYRDCLKGVRTERWSCDSAQVGGARVFPRQTTLLRTMSKLA